ncbi:MAG: thiamine pyrophosphate-binding protein [Candidatus Methylacidiphilales bacterium]|nr:thiamine pyrophosphate-binding protein [Candidatus Methylacidiphilales bacterium]
MSIRVADYVACFLADHGVRDIFVVTGGGAMHLNDAIGREKRIRYICNHHEQACAMAAESYARLTGRVGVVNVTTGPGGINALNGVFGAWTDSVPMLVVSGQVKRETCMAFHEVPGLRQLGDQEADILGMVKGITKYAALVRDPSEIRFHLEKALHLALSGRPGPCWIDIPIDVQGARIDPSTLTGFTVPAPEGMESKELQAVCVDIRRRAEAAQRPVILVGAGIRASQSRDRLLRLLEHWAVPVTTAWNAQDAIWNAHPQFAGRPGSIGDRAGNFAVQNADFLLVLGSRLNVRQVSYNWPSFARAAYKVVVDIDAAELHKPTWRADLPVHADLREVIDILTALDPIASTPQRQRWLSQCRSWRERYPATLPEYWDTDNGVNPYCFASALFAQLAEDEVVVCGDGTACVTTFQAADIREGQRLYTNSGCASMGYDLPGAIGASAARPGQRVVCLAGDGSIMMNLQELQTIQTHGFPVKIFILNNRGYHSIRQTQQNFFPDGVMGCGEESGLGFPDFGKLAAVFGFPYSAARTHAELAGVIAATLAHTGPAVCEIFLDLNQQFAPKLSSKRLDDGTIVSPPLEDLAPFLQREELVKNMFIPEYHPTPKKS